MTVYMIVPTIPVWACTAVRPLYERTLRRMSLDDLPEVDRGDPPDPQRVHAMLCRVEDGELDRGVRHDGYFTTNGYMPVCESDESYIVHVGEDPAVLKAFCQRINDEQAVRVSAEWDRREAAGEVEA